MQEVNSLCTDSGLLLAEYCIVGIPHNTALLVFALTREKILRCDMCLCDCFSYLTSY